MRHQDAKARREAFAEELKQDALTEQQLRKWKSGAAWLGLALIVSVGLVMPFSAGHSLHRYAGGCMPPQQHTICGRIKELLRKPTLELLRNRLAPLSDKRLCDGGRGGSRWNRRGPESGRDNRRTGVEARAAQSPAAASHRLPRIPKNGQSFAKFVRRWAAEGRECQLLPDR